MSNISAARHADEIIIRDNCTLASATVYTGESYAYEPPIADEGWGDRPLYAVWKYNSHWPTLVTLATGSSWEDAYEAAIDALPTVALEDLHEAFDCTRWEWMVHHAAAEALVRECGVTTLGDYEWPELASGYSHQSNASGTGVVYTENLRMDPLTVAQLRELRIALRIEGPNA